MTRLFRWFAWAAAMLAAVASVAGLFTGIYRDVPAMIDQAQAADVATLFVAVPLLALSLRQGWRVVALASLAYLTYTYSIFSFEIVVNPMTPVYIAVLSVSLWALVLGVPSVVVAAGAGERVARRTTAGFLFVIALLFAALWLSEIVEAIASGTLPPSVAALRVPTSAVYALDLGFVLPMFVLAAVILLRRSPHAPALARGSLVFLVLMALSILPMFAIQASHGEPVDLAVAGLFAAIAAIAAVLIAVERLPARPAPHPHGIPMTS
jgi:hypothetical protein